MHGASGCLPGVSFLVHDILDDTYLPHVPCTVVCSSPVCVGSTIWYRSAASSWCWDGFRISVLPLVCFNSVAAAACIGGKRGAISLWAV
jgi:hypothetical protein